jgi:hypothetical protein
MAKMKRRRYRTSPEAKIQADIIVFLNKRGWMVENMHGNAFQKGIPDLYCFNAGLDMHRWVDVKNPASYVYTKDQCQKWPKWEAAGLGVWIMMAATVEEYKKLFKPHNFRDYWKPRYDKYLLDIDEIIADVREDA